MDLSTKAEAEGTAHPEKMIAPLYCAICGALPARFTPQGNRCRDCYAEERRVLMAMRNPATFPGSVAEFLGALFGKKCGQSGDNEKPPLS